jgi:hypothetical protein
VQRRGISRLLEVSGENRSRSASSGISSGIFTSATRQAPDGECIHLTANRLQSNLPRGDLAEVRTAEGKLNLFVAIDRTSKFAHLRMETRAGKMEAAQFLRDLLQALPYRIHTVLTDNGIQFTNRALGRVISPFLTGCIRRTYAAIFSFMAGVIPPMPMLGRSLLEVHSHCVA